MLLFPNLYLSTFSFIWYDYDDLCIMPVRTIEKICARLVRDTPFIHSPFKSGSQVLKLVRWLIRIINIDATMWHSHCKLRNISSVCRYWSWCLMTNQILIWNNDPSTFPNVTSCIESISMVDTRQATATFPLTAHAPRKGLLRSHFWEEICFLVNVHFLVVDFFY